MKCCWDKCEEQPEDLKEHLELHIKQNNDYTCRWIGCAKNNEPMNKAGFTAHMRTHSGDRPFKCSKCSKDFTRNDALGKHLKRHEAEDKTIHQLVDKSFSLAEARDIEELKVKELLREKHYQVTTRRILCQYLDQSLEEGWKKYL